MGMFDTIRSSYNLGKGMEGELQTKDLVCLMQEYWISPSGQLYEIDFSGTQDFVLDPENDTALMSGVCWVPNGNHGRVRATRHYGVVEVYPSKWCNDDCCYTCQITFCDGKIVSVVHQPCPLL